MDEEAATYEMGVEEAQAFIDRHPHGFPAETMTQYGNPVRGEGLSLQSYGYLAALARRRTMTRV